MNWQLIKDSDGSTIQHRREIDDDHYLVVAKMGEGYGWWLHGPELVEYYVQDRSNSIWISEILAEGVEATWQQARRAVEQAAKDHT